MLFEKTVHRARRKQIIYVNVAGQYQRDYYIKQKVVNIDSNSAYFVFQLLGTGFRVH